MADDPLAGQLSGGGDPYGASTARTTLERLFSLASPQAAAEAAEMMLHRLALLELFFEEEHGVKVEAEELAAFLARRRPDVQREADRLAQYFFGRIAHREGG
ncbi:MAG TPA: hypothetical protein ENI92_07790 [Bacteroidetes bacterium]|nr:hypothetical protein [Bacteroidota bacterium]